MRAYEVSFPNCPDYEPTVRFGETVAKVRYAVWADLKDLSYDVTFADIRVRFLGDRRTPRQIAQQQCDDFNKLAPVGTWVQVRQLIGDPDMEHSFCTQVKEPGAFVMSGDQAVVKIPGDCYALECVTPIRWAKEIA